MTELNESSQLTRDVATYNSVNAILDPPTLRFTDQTEVGTSDMAQKIHRAVKES